MEEGALLLERVGLVEHGVGADICVAGGCLDFCDSKEIPETAVIVDVDPASLS